MRESSRSVHPLAAPDRVTVVSGLPRAGTSLLMQLLDAAGLTLACDDARAELDRLRHQSVSRRDELVSALDDDLVALYERQRARGGAGAGPLQGRRCGACRIEIDKGELARISAAADDDVLRCPECGAILLRVKGTGA